MPNIFSGMLGNQGGGDAAALVQYKDRLDKWNALQEYKRRNEDLASQSGAYDEATQSMSPERQNQMRLFQMMAGGRETGDKGLEGMGKGFSQRGATIADNQKQNLDHDLDKKFHDYKVKNSIPGTTNRDIEYAQFMEELRIKDPDAWERARIYKRQEQWLDTETGFHSTVTGKTVSKNLMQAGIDKERAGDMANRLDSFYGDVDDTETFMDQFYDQRQRIQALHGFTEDGKTTGLAALINWIPGSDSMEWDRLRETIVSNIGLDKILELKASSAQGATGLGALNEAELRMLQTYLGDLGQARDEKGLKAVLVNMDRWMGRTMAKKHRTLIRQRREYNAHKGALGLDPKAKDDILPEQERLFKIGTPYEPRNILSPLSEEVDYNKKYDLISTDQE